MSRIASTRNKSVSFSSPLCSSSDPPPTATAHPGARSKSEDNTAAAATASVKAARAATRVLGANLLLLAAFALVLALLYGPVVCRIAALPSSAPPSTIHRMCDFVQPFVTRIPVSSDSDASDKNIDEMEDILEAPASSPQETESIAERSVEPIVTAMQATTARAVPWDPLNSPTPIPRSAETTDGCRTFINSVFDTVESKQLLRRPSSDGPTPTVPNEVPRSIVFSIGASGSTLRSQELLCSIESALRQNPTSEITVYGWLHAERILRAVGGAMAFSHVAFNALEALLTRVRPAHFAIEGVVIVRGTPLQASPLTDLSIRLAHLWWHGGASIDLDFVSTAPLPRHVVVFFDGEDDIGRVISVPKNDPLIWDAMGLLSRNSSIRSMSELLTSLLEEDPSLRKPTSGDRRLARIPRDNITFFESEFARSCDTLRDISSHDIGVTWHLEELERTNPRISESIRDTGMIMHHFGRLSVLLGVFQWSCPATHALVTKFNPEF